MADCSSGIKVVAEEEDTLILTLDKTQTRNRIPLSGQSVPTTFYGPYVAAICECGEFTVDISFRPPFEAGPEDEIRLFSYDFICK